MPEKYWVNSDFKLFQWILQTFCTGLREQIIKISGIWLAYQKQKLLNIKSDICNSEFSGDTLVANHRNW